MRKYEKNAEKNDIHIIPSSVPAVLQLQLQTMARDRSLRPLTGIRDLILSLSLSLCASAHSHSEFPSVRPSLRPHKPQKVESRAPLQGHAAERHSPRSHRSHPCAAAARVYHRRCHAMPPRRRQLYAAVPILAGGRLRGGDGRTLCCRVVDSRRGGGGCAGEGGGGGSFGPSPPPWGVMCGSP